MFAVVSFKLPIGSQRSTATSRPTSGSTMRVHAQAPGHGRNRGASVLSLPDRPISRTSLLPIRRQPSVSSPADPLERQADEVADRVTRMTDPSPASMAVDKFDGSGQHEGTNLDWQSSPPNAATAASRDRHSTSSSPRVRPSKAALRLPTRSPLLLRAAVWPRFQPGPDPCR